MKGALSATADVFRSRSLRGAEASWALHLTAEWAYLVSIGLFAYRAGGATAVGLAGLASMLPGAVTAPFAAAIADRFRRERVVLAVSVGRALLLAASCFVVAAELRAAYVYVLAALGSVVASAFRPAHAALVPLLARTPRELVAANTVASTAEGLATFVGPVAAGLVFAAAGPAPAFALAASALLAAGLAVVRIDTEQQPAPSTRTAAAEALLGLRRTAGDGHVRLLVALFGAQTLVRGALNTLLVLVALELLATGEAGVGLLGGAVGAGGLAGGAVALALVGRERLAGFFALALACWGVPIALVGVFPELTLTVVLLALVGVANSVFDVAGLTLLQRLVADRVLARVLGTLEGVALAAIGLGAFATPFLVEAIGLRPALVATGGLLPVVAALALPALARVDAATAVPTRELEVVRSVDLFVALPANVTEQLARGLSPVRYPPGSPMVRAGEVGDRFFLLAEGLADVTQGGRTVSALGPGDYFGEIALLHDVPRTATVTARTAISAYALDRDDFVAAVAGHRTCARAAETVVEGRIAASTGRA